MNFELLTLSGTKFNGDILEVILPSATGEIGIMPNHEPLMTIVLPGKVEVKKKSGGTETFVVFGGILEVKDGKSARLLADEAEYSEELIEKEIQEALNKAQNLKDNAKNKHELAKAQVLIDRQSVRLGVARMHRRKQR